MLKCRRGERPDIPNAKSSVAKPHHPAKQASRYPEPPNHFFRPAHRELKALGGVVDSKEPLGTRSPRPLTCLNRPHVRTRLHSQVNMIRASRVGYSAVPRHTLSQIQGTVRETSPKCGIEMDGGMLGRFAGGSEESECRD